MNKLFAYYYTFQSLNVGCSNNLNHVEDDNDEFVNEDFNVKCIEEELVYIPVIRYLNNSNVLFCNDHDDVRIDENIDHKNVKNRSLKRSISNLFNINNNDKKDLNFCRTTNVQNEQHSTLPTAFRSNFIFFKK